MRSQISYVSVVRESAGSTQHSRVCRASFSPDPGKLPEPMTRRTPPLCATQMHQRSSHMVVMSTHAAALAVTVCYSLVTDPSLHVAMSPGLFTSIVNSARQAQVSSAPPSLPNRRPHTLQAQDYYIQSHFRPSTLDGPTDYTPEMLHCHVTLLPLTRF